MLVSHVVLYAGVAVWLVATPLLVAVAVVAGFATGRGTAFLQSWAYLTTYLVFEVVGTVVSEWGRGVIRGADPLAQLATLVTLWALAQGKWPYSSEFKVGHTRLATAWCALLTRLGHWMLGKRIFVRLPEGGVRGTVPVIVVMRHVSTNDVVLSPYVFGWRLGFNLRMVMKKELLWDPFIEAAGTRCDNFFIDRWNKSDMELEVQGVSQLMAPPYQDADGRMKVARVTVSLVLLLILGRASPFTPRARG